MLYSRSFLVIYFVYSSLYVLIPTCEESALNESSWPEKWKISGELKEKNYLKDHFLKAHLPWSIWRNNHVCVYRGRCTKTQAERDAHSGRWFATWKRIRKASDIQWYHWQLWFSRGKKGSTPLVSWNTGGEGLKLIPGCASHWVLYTEQKPN